MDWQKHQELKKSRDAWKKRATEYSEAYYKLGVVFILTIGIIATIIVIFVYPIVLGQ